MNEPEVIIQKDFDGFFNNIVQQAIKMNVDSNTPMVAKVTINSGPYRAYDMSYDREKQSDGTINCKFDFYSAGRNFGLDFTTADVANCIALKMLPEKEIKK